MDFLAVCNKKENNKISFASRGQKIGVCVDAFRLIVIDLFTTSTSASTSSVVVLFLLANGERTVLTPLLSVSLSFVL